MKTLLKTDYFLLNFLTSVVEILDDFPHPWVSQCYGLSHNWHTEAIRLAGRIWGNMQREMARLNGKVGKH